MHVVFSSDYSVTKSGYYAKLHVSEGNCSHQSLYFEPMLCADYAFIGNGICDKANDNLVCQYDGGDCTLGGNTTNCNSLQCVENLKFDPCPKYEKIGNDQCDKENFNLICSFDAGDCQAG